MKTENFSVKQIAWAKSIRDEAMPVIESLMKSMSEKATNQELAAKQVQMVRDELESKDVQWWIDRRPVVDGRMKTTPVDIMREAAADAQKR
jgi:hypothetical protein